MHFTCSETSPSFIQPLISFGEIDLNKFLLHIEAAADVIWSFSIGFPMRHIGFQTTQTIASRSWISFTHSYLFHLDVFFSAYISELLHKIFVIFHICLHSLWGCMRTCWSKSIHPPLSTNNADALDILLSPIVCSVSCIRDAFVDLYCCKTVMHCDSLVR